MLQHIQANGISIAYRIDGPADGPVVVLSNSLMSSHAMWDDTMPALTDRYRVLRYDTHGHGQSQVTPAPYSIALLAQDLVGLLDALQIQQAHLVGLSMGGMICQYVGAHHPERVLSLGLCDTASEMPPRALWEERFATARAQGIAGLVDGTIKRWFVDGFPAKAPDKIAAVRTMILATPVEGYLGCASAVRDMAQTTMLLKIKAPTLVLVGKQDPACTVEQSTVLHRMIDGSRMEVIDNAAHLSNIEQPAEFNRILRGFLDKEQSKIYQSQGGGASTVFNAIGNLFN
jgi:3-oxoadipate enol-lactonase